MTESIVICPACGSENIVQDYEDDSMWYCLDCNYRFPKAVDIDKTGADEVWNENELDNYEDYEEEMDGGLFAEDW